MVCFFFLHLQRDVLVCVRLPLRSCHSLPYIVFLQHRVRPFPDPDRVEQTTWMSSDQIFSESMKGSAHWVESGSGNLGYLYVEVLGCTDLPKMNAVGKTDAFACLVFEDAITNTDVIGNCLSPRWMPWCRRAFVFNICHPSSSLFLGLCKFTGSYCDVRCKLQFFYGQISHCTVLRGHQLITIQSWVRSMGLTRCHGRCTHR